MFFSGIERANSLKMTALVFAGLVTTRTYNDNIIQIKLRSVFQVRSEEHGKNLKIMRLVEHKEELSSNVIT